MPDTRRPSADPLETLSEHLGRLLQQADALLTEWQRYGDSVRARVDGQVDELARAVGVALERSGRDAADTLDRHLDRHIGERLSALRTELERLQRSAAAARADDGTAAGPPADTGARPWLLVLALTANVMLAALLVLDLRGDDASAGSKSAPVDAGAPAPGAIPAAICHPLFDDAGPDAVRGFVDEATARLCGDRAASARRSIAPYLGAPTDAGVGDGGADAGDDDE